MQRREFAAVLLLASVTLLAGCGGGGANAEYIELTPTVTSAAETETGWEFDVTLEAEASAADHVWQDVEVTGHNYDSDRICTLEFGAVEAGETVTGTLTCDRAPVVIAVQTDSIAASVDETHKSGNGIWWYRDDDIDSYLETQSLALTDVSGGVPQYTQIPSLAGGTAEFEVRAFGYAQCELVTAGVTPEDLDGDRPWLERELVGAQSPDNVTVRVQAGVPEAADTRATLTPVQLPTGDATAELRDIIESYPDQPPSMAAGDSDRYEYVGVRTDQADERAPVVVYRYVGGQGALSGFHATLLGAGENENRSMTIDPETVLDVAARAEVGHATVSKDLASRTAESGAVDCSSVGSTVSTETRAGTTTVTYVVQDDGQVWTVRVVSEYP